MSRGVRGLRARVVAPVAALGAALLLVPSAATAAPGSFDLPVWFYWDRTEIDVVIIPPEHGQIYNANGVFGGEGPGELTTDNSYLRAIEDSIAGWDTAVVEFGSDRLKNSLRTNVYVLGRDSEAASKLLSAEIIVVTDQSKATILGLAVTGLSCIVDNSKMLVTSFTYADMYNVNGQEYGHCLGLDHVTYDQPVLDVMNGHYPHNIGARDTPLHCISNLDVKGLEYVFFGGGETASVATADYRTTDCQS